MFGLFHGMSEIFESVTIKHPEIRGKVKLITERGAIFSKNAKRSINFMRKFNVLSEVTAVQNNSKS